MSTRSYIQHGRRHGAGGSDPIPGAIYFDADNEGGWLYIRANDGLAVDDSPDGNSFGGIILVDDSGAGSDSGVYIASVDSDITVQSYTGTISLFAPNVEVLLQEDLVAVNLNTGAKFAIYDSSSNPIFEVREDGSIHIPTGASIVADL